MTVLLASALSRIRATLKALSREAASFVEATAEALPRRMPARSAHERRRDFAVLFAEFERDNQELIHVHRPRAADLRLATRMMKTGQELQHAMRICVEMASPSKPEAANPAIDVDLAPLLAAATRRSASLLSNGVVASIAGQDDHIELARLQFDSLIDQLLRLVAGARETAGRDPSSVASCVQATQYCDQLQQLAEIALRIYEFGTRYERWPITSIRPMHTALGEGQ